jgi:RimJ/RimL family protein N-acetyltransferase
MILITKADKIVSIAESQWFCEEMNNYGNTCEVVLYEEYFLMILKIDGKIELVPISLDFVIEIHESFNDEIIELLPVEKLSQNIKDTTKFIERSVEQRNSGTDLVWVILNDNQFAGCCGIHRILSKKPHFGLWIKKEQQDRGIGKKVVHYVLNWGISNLDIEFIKYPVDERNIRSVKLIQGLGLKLSDHYQIGEQKKLEVDEYRIYKKITPNNL